MLEYIIDLIAPHVCIGCKKEGSLLCCDCQNQLSPAGMLTDAVDPTVLQSVFAATPYKGLAKDLIHKLKFEHARSAAALIARCIDRDLPELPPHVLLCHLPTANRRVRTRGYDQSALIARQLARLRSLPYASLLARHGSQRQVGHTRAIRRQQLQEMFSVRQPHRVYQQRVLLVDDVVTTGASLEAAARALCRAGASQVSAVVFATA